MPKGSTFSRVQKMIAKHAPSRCRGLEIRKHRGAWNNFGDANYKVVRDTGRGHQTFSDGTSWNGVESLGHFRSVKDAASFVVKLLRSN